MGEWHKTGCVLCGQNCGLEVLVENNRMIIAPSWAQALEIMLPALFATRGYAGAETGACAERALELADVGPLGRLIDPRLKNTDAAARERIPDPGARETFQRSRLRWGDLQREGHREWLAYYRRLLEDAAIDAVDITTPRVCMRPTSIPLDSANRGLAPAAVSAAPVLAEQLPGG